VHSSSERSFHHHHYHPDFSGCSLEGFPCQHIESMIAVVLYSKKLINKPTVVNIVKKIQNLFYNKGIQYRSSFYMKHI